MEDPTLHRLIEFSWRYRRMILAVVLVWGAAGLALGMSRPVEFTARRVLQAATTAQEGAIENLDTAAASLEKYVASQVLAHRIPRGTVLQAHALRGEPPALEPTSLVELVATGETETSVTQAIEIAGRQLIESEEAVFREDRARLDRHAAALEESLARNGKEKLTADSHAVFIQLVRELSDTKRLASPARAYTAAFLGAAVAHKSSGAEGVALYALLGVLAGMACGYSVAFFVAGVRALRSSGVTRTGLRTGGPPGMERSA